MTDAKAVVVIVIGGNLGEGFSVQTDNPTILLSLSDLLEDVAAQLRRDFRDSEL